MRPQDSSRIQIAFVVAFFTLITASCSSTPDTSDDDPFGDAILSADLPKLTSFLDAGHDPNAQDWEGKTRLYYAAHVGHREIVELLLSRGADVNLPTRGHFHERPLHAAAKHGHAEVLQLLLAHGATVDVRVGHSRETALQFAARRGHPDAVRVLLAHRADPNARDNRGGTQLHLEFPSRTPDAPFAQVATMLLDHGADVNATAELPSGLTPLISAAAIGLTESVTLLLSRGANPHAETDGGATATSMARSGGHTKVVEILTRHVQP